MLMTKGVKVMSTAGQVLIEFMFGEGFGRSRGAIQFLYYPKTDKVKLQWFRFATPEEKAQGEKSQATYFVWLSTKFGFSSGRFLHSSLEQGVGEDGKGYITIVRLTFENITVRVDVDKGRFIVRNEDVAYVAALSKLMPDEKVDEGYDPWRVVRVKGA